MQSHNNYIQAARSKTRGSNANASGNAGNFRHADGQNPVMGNTRGWNNAAGGNGVPSNTQTPTSQPIILVVENASSGAVTNFNLWGAFDTFQNAGTWNNGGASLTIGSVTISSGNPSVGYQFILEQSKVRPMIIAQTQVVLVGNGSVLQLNAPLNVNGKDSTGRVSSTPVQFPTNNFQFQPNQVTSYTNYQIDGSISVQISYIAPQSTTQYWFYPALDIDVARAAMGGNASASFANPGTNAQTIQLG